jgi:hypothetical protein
MDREGHLMTSPTYLILGATGGMGQAVYERLSKRDASLLIGGRDPARLEALSKCTGTGALAGDARASLAVERAVARTVEHFGRIDGAVNLVGSLLLKPANLTKPEEWDDVIAANPGCAFPLVRAAAFAGATHEPTAQARPFRESGTASLRPVPDLGESDELSKLSLVRRSRIGRVLLEREVSAGAVVVPPVGREGSAEMPLVENEDVVQALSEQRSNESLRVGVLPRGARSDRHLVKAERLNSPVEVRAVDPIAISDQVPGGRLPRERLDHLLRGPAGRRVRGHVDVEELPSIEA